MRVGIDSPPNLIGISDIEKNNRSNLEESIRAPKSTGRSDLTDTPRKSNTNSFASRNSGASSNLSRNSILSNTSIARIISRGSIQSKNSLSYVSRGSIQSKGSLSRRKSSNSTARFLKGDEISRKETSSKAGFLHHNVDWHLRSAYSPPIVTVEAKTPTLKRDSLFSFSSNDHHSIFLGIKTDEFKSATIDNEYCAFKRSGYNIPLLIATIILLFTLGCTFHQHVAGAVYGEPLVVSATLVLFFGAIASLCFSFNMLVVNTIGIENSSFRPFHSFAETLFHSRYGQVLENVMIVCVAVSVSLYTLGVVVSASCIHSDSLLYYSGCDGESGNWSPQEELIFTNLIVLLAQVNMYDLIS